MPVARPARLPARLALALLAGALIAALPGCTRRPAFVPAGADSSLARGPDSLPDQVRAMRERWRTEGAGGEAARIAARLLLRDLRARLAAEPRASWEERARALLDSLDVGAEFATARCVLCVNFFDRSNPSAGSWPWVYWCATDSLAAQAVEGEGMNLLGVASRGLFGDPATPPGPPGVAALFTRRAGGGRQPLLMTWRVTGRLELAQTLGPDSLGGTGTGRFESPTDSVVALTTSTWRPTPGFEECATCPHVVHQKRFRWGLEGFERFEDAIVPSPYVTLVQFITALTTGDREGVLARVTQPSVAEDARRAGWAVPRGVWRVAPSRDEAPAEVVLFRGTREAWKVRFARRDREWRLAGLDSTSAAIE